MAVAIARFANGLDTRGIDPPVADGMVVLTGGADRIGEALALLHKGKARRLLISGVNAGSGPDLLRRSWPGNDAVFDCCVDLDYRARNTRGNAAEAALWARRNGFRSVLLVTASYHLPRAQLEFRRAMPDLAVFGHPVIPEASRIRRWWQDQALVRIIALEFGKFHFARLRAWLAG
ncbi:MAG: YdcF family protein [Proteobacteria bacterium]|nr:YdcF family protein [Pseudomonadota bacterium]